GRQPGGAIARAGVNVYIRYDGYNIAPVYIAGATKLSTLSKCQKVKVCMTARRTASPREFRKYVLSKPPNRNHVVPSRRHVAPRATQLRTSTQLNPVLTPSLPSRLQALSRPGRRG